MNDDSRPERLINILAVYLLACQRIAELQTRISKKYELTVTEQQRLNRSRRFKAMVEADLIPELVDCGVESLAADLSELSRWPDLEFFSVRLLNCMGYISSTADRTDRGQALRVALDSNVQRLMRVRASIELGRIQGDYLSDLLILHRA